MNARERNAARYRRDDGLSAWTLKWVMDGHAMSCALCGVGQFARDAGEPFQHVATCAIRSDFAQHPWHDLAELLRELPTVPA